jgi:hypothetical protein
MPVMQVLESLWIVEKRALQQTNLKNNWLKQIRVDTPRTHSNRKTN